MLLSGYEHHGLHTVRGELPTTRRPHRRRDVRVRIDVERAAGILVRMLLVLRRYSPGPKAALDQLGLSPGKPRLSPR